LAYFGKNQAGLAKGLKDQKIKYFQNSGILLIPKMAWLGFAFPNWAIKKPSKT